MQIADNEQLSGLVISLDYQKAFGTIDKEIIIAALKKLNFGSNFRQYIETILTNTQSSIKNGGWLSNCFSISTSRVVKQGCCVSPLLFVMVAELLAIKVRSNEDIKGILKDSILNDNLKLLQYADYMTLLLKKKTDLHKTLREIGEFAKISGLNLNKQKSVCLWIGKSKDKTEGGEGIAWAKTEENIKVLGVYFNFKIEASKIQQNWTEQINAIKLSAQRWSEEIYLCMAKLLLQKLSYYQKLFMLYKRLLCLEVLAQIDSIIFSFYGRKSTLTKKRLKKLKEITYVRRP